MTALKFLTENRPLCHFVTSPHAVGSHFAIRDGIPVDFCLVLIKIMIENPHIKRYLTGSKAQLTAITIALTCHMMRCRNILYNFQLYYNFPLTVNASIALQLYDIVPSDSSSTETIFYNTDNSYIRVEQIQKNDL